MGSLKYNIINDDYSEYKFEINHMFVNKSLAGEPICHEWIFINYMLHVEIRKDQYIASKFLMFALQYYPDYKWQVFNYRDPLATVVIECFIWDKAFEGITFGDSNPDDDRKQALEFGNMLADFLIRHLGYSLVGCQQEKIIITARGDCDKRFWDYLYKGFSLQRLSRIWFNTKNGRFELVPALPTKDVGFEIDELIENLDMSYVRVK